jgi:hypothetical protein
MTASGASSISFLAPPGGPLCALSYASSNADLLIKSSVIPLHHLFSVSTEPIRRRFYMVNQ